MTAVISKDTGIWRNRLPGGGNAELQAIHTTWRIRWNAKQPGLDIGYVTVGADGKVVGPPQMFSLPPLLTADQAPAESAVCVSDSSNNVVGEMPLTILPSPVVTPRG